MLGPLALRDPYARTRRTPTNLPSPSRSHARTLAAGRRLDPRLWNHKPSWRASENKNPAEAGLVLRYGSFEVSSVPSFFLQTGYRFCNRPFAVVPRTIRLVTRASGGAYRFSIGAAGEPYGSLFAINIGRIMPSRSVATVVAAGVLSDRAGKQLTVVRTSAQR
jgi:hypothetical protein